MKKALFSLIIFILSGSIILYSLYAPAQNIDTPTLKASGIQVQFQNNSLLPGSFTLKVKSKESAGYGVVSFKLFSFQKYEEAYKAGTSIYLVTKKEQEQLMQGKDATGRFLLEVKESDKGKIIKLVP